MSVLQGWCEHWLQSRTWSMFSVGKVVCMQMKHVSRYRNHIGEYRKVFTVAVFLPRNRSSSQGCGVGGFWSESDFFVRLWMSNGIISTSHFKIGNSCWNGTISFETLVETDLLLQGRNQRKISGAEITFGNDDDVTDVPSTMMRPFCYDRLTKKMMMSSENRKFLHDYYQSHILYHQRFFVNILAVVFLKFSDVKPITQSIFDIKSQHP